MEEKDYVQVYFEVTEENGDKNGISLKLKVPPEMTEDERNGMYKNLNMDIVSQILGYKKEQMRFVTKEYYDSNFDD